MRKHVVRIPTAMKCISLGPKPAGKALLGCILLAIFSPHVAHAEAGRLHLVEVFTTSDRPVIYRQASISGLEPHLPGTRIYMLDRLQRLEARLSRDLPTDPGQARKRALEHLHQINETDRARLQQVAIGLARAAHYGIDRYPAMVFNGHAVVYGLTDLEAALVHYRHWHRP